MRLPSGCCDTHAGFDTEGPILDLSHPLANMATRFYDYRDSAQARDSPTEFLKDFRGYLQTDAYAAYECPWVLNFSRVILPVGCWAHAQHESSSTPG